MAEFTRKQYRSDTLRLLACKIMISLFQEIKSITLLLRLNSYLTLGVGEEDQ